MNEMRTELVARLDTKSSQQGFTLIELIMVIVILGILSAFALPKFADLSGSASKATVQGALGAVKSGAAIAHAQDLANGSTGADITLEGSTLTLVNGYPSEADLGDLADLTEFTITLAASNAGSSTILSSGVTVGSSCFTYEDATASVPPAISAVTVTTGTGTSISCP